MVNVQTSKAIERWLREQVAKSYDEYAADPNIGIPASQVMTRLRAARKPRQT